MQQHMMQWGLYAQQYASMYSFPAQTVNAAVYQAPWDYGPQPTDSHSTVEASTPGFS
jgi:hypothetical protein